MAKIQAALRSWDNLPNTMTLANGGYVGPMKASSLVVTDGISILIEGQLTDSPLLFLERGSHGRLTPLGETIVGGTVRFSDYGDYDALEAEILGLLDGAMDEKPKEREANFCLLTQSPGAAARIVGTIRRDFQHSSMSTDRSV